METCTVEPCKESDKPLHQTIQAISYPETPAVLDAVKAHAAAVDPDEVDKWGNTPLIIAAERGLPQVVKILQEMGADVNKANNDGVTPVIAAIAAMKKK